MTGKFALAGPRPSCPHFFQKLPHLAAVAVTVATVKPEIQVSRGACFGSRSID